MASKRAYKLQEFVAHASNVNCVKFGRLASRTLITGGEDMKVNLWAIGKPNALLSLTGLTSPVESVSFDSSEVTIGAGAASGTIKIWDVEEAKVVRTFTGHRSNCVSLDFHPFGEFLASGSSDTNMKIWDIRKKRCIHTYKGHARRIDVLKFTPDGRWIISGGADNSVKIWDLTAGKLLHDFNHHEGPINCLDFHPHEFLLATGSADKTVKFCDLETFELIGSSGPENSREYFVTANVVRSMKFNIDGKTLFCGLYESLKVLSWEPIICHDVVDVGWSTLADLTVDEGKLLGCSYNQNCVGVWVVDLRRNERAESHLTGSVNRPVQADTSISSVFDKLSVSNPGSEIASNTQLKCSMSASKEILVSASSTSDKILSKEPRTIDLRLTRSDSIPLLSPRVILKPNIVDDKKRQRAAVEALPSSKFSSKVNHSSNARVLPDHSLARAAPTHKSRPRISAHSNKAASFIPILVPRHSSKVDADPIIGEAASGDLSVVEPQNIIKGNLAVNHDKEDGKLMKMIDSRSSNNDVEVGCRRITDDVECNKVIAETSLRVNVGFDFRMRAPENQNVHVRIFQSRPISSERKSIRETSSHGENNLSKSVCGKSIDSNEVDSWYGLSGFEKRNYAAKGNPEFANINRSAVIQLRKLMESSGRHAVELRPSSSSFDSIQYETTIDGSRWQASLAGRQTKSTIDEDAMAVLMENHQEFIHVMKSRKIKLEEVSRCWRRNEKEFLDATLRMSDCAVTVDIICILMENIKFTTLGTCTSLLRLASSLFESTYDRHLNIALEVVLKLVKRFGDTISSTLSAAAPVGVDLEAERRLEWCDLCFQELKKVSVSLVSLTRRQGEVGRSAQELSLFLQDIFPLSSI